MLRNILLRFLIKRPYRTIGRQPVLVVCAAIKIDGVVYPCRRHADAPVRWEAGDDGFIDNLNRFITREEAYAIAHEQGQIRVYPPKHYLKHCRATGRKPALFSENLY